MENREYLLEIIEKVTDLLDLSPTNLYESNDSEVYGYLYEGDIYMDANLLKNIENLS